MKNVLYFLMLWIIFPFNTEAGTVTNLQATAISHDVIRLTPEKSSNAFEFILDANESIIVKLTAATQNMEVKFISPDGNEYLVGSPSTEFFSSSIKFIEVLEGRSGANYNASFKSPKVGLWRILVSQPTKISNDLNISVQILYENSVRAILVGAGESYPLGTQVRFAVVVFDNTEKIRNLKVDAKLIRSDTTSKAVPIDFRDDGTNADETPGDGIFQAFIKVPNSGKYAVQIKTSGMASTGLFQRSTSGQIDVLPRRAVIEDFFTERGIDLNGDSLLDQIAITPSASIFETGIYTIGVTLRALNGNEIYKTIEKNLPIGTTAPEISFPTQDISRQLKMNGPYQVAEIRFLLHSENDLTPADIRYNLGYTSEYLLDKFQRARLELIGTGNANGVDTTEIGVFDKLKIELDVRADISGLYNYSASLVDLSGKELGFYSDKVFLTSGSSKIDFYYCGFPIGVNDANGPYFLSNLLIYGSSQSIVENNAFSTQAFQASQFDGTSSRGKFIYLSGSPADYTFSKFGKDQMAYDKYGNIINLTGVRRLRFSSNVLAFDIDDNAGKAYRIYQAAFNRVPDSSGLGFWIKMLDDKISLLEIAENFLNSDEFASIYGRNLSNERFITSLYNNILHREPELGGYTFWLNSLKNGTSRAKILEEFSESSENRAGVAKAIADGIKYTPFPC